MRRPPFDPDAPKQTVSITVNSDLYAKAKSLGVNASKVAEQGLADAYAARRRATLAAELQRDLAAVQDYAEQHGSFGELAREHYARDDDAV